MAVTLGLQPKPDHASTALKTALTLPLMSKIYTRLPGNAPVTHDVIKDNKIPVVLSASPTKIYGWDGHRGAYNERPSYTMLDEQLETAERLGVDVFLHPLINRCLVASEGRYRPLVGNVEKLAMPTVERYAHHIKRMNLAHELIAVDIEFWGEIVGFYKKVKNKFPHLELWTGEYIIRSHKSRQEILERLKPLQGVLTGFLTTDYIKLTNNLDADSQANLEERDLPAWMNPRIHWNSYTRWLAIAKEEAKIGAMAMAPRIRLEYLYTFWAELAKLGIRGALETTIKSHHDGDRVRAAQINGYQAMWDACKYYNADLWIWYVCDESNIDFEDDSRLSCGFWDAKGWPRLNTKMFDEAQADDFYQDLNQST